MLGALAGAACGGAQAEPQTATTAHPTADHGARGDHDACGNHEPGKCGAPQAASSATQPSQAGARVNITKSETIAPGKAVEVNVSFPAASHVTGKFKSSAPVAWNVHSHPAGGMVEHQKGTSAAGDILFSPQSPGVYSFMWKNEGTEPVTIDVTLSGDGGATELSH